MTKIVNNKGFSMVEILAVVVILGVVSTIGIVTVSKLIDKSRIHYYETQENQLVLAAQSYTNDNKNILPKTVGEMRTITLKELRDNNYIKEEIVDQNKNKCYEEKHKEKDKNGNDVELEGSRVEVYKSTKTDYIYTGYLECDACVKFQDKEDGNIAPTSCYTSETKKEPNINIDIPNLDSNSNTILDKSHKITITIKGNNEDNNIKVASYSYKIYQDGVVKKTSGLKINNKQSNVTITDELYKYVPGVVKVVVSATNSDGISKSLSFSRDLKDFKSPKCGRVSYDSNNQMTSYNSGASIKCGQPGYKWIGIGNINGFRQAWIICNDEFGGGCAQHEYSVNMTKEGENEIVYLSDKTGNKQSELDKCIVKKCIDKTTPKIVIKIYKANSSGKIGKNDKPIYTYDKPVSTTAVTYTIPQEKNNTWLNKNNFPYGVYVEVTVSDPLSKLQKYTWYQNVKNQKENATLTPNQKVEEKTWTYNQSGNNSYTKGINITDDGVRIEKIQVWDQSGNSSIYNLILKIDRTAPTCKISGDGKWNPDGANIHTTCTETKTISTMNACPHTNNHKVKNNVRYSISDVAGNSSSCTYKVGKATHYTKAACEVYKRSESLCKGCQTYYGCRRVTHGKETKNYNKNANHWFPFTKAGATKMDNFLVAGYIYLAGQFSDGTYNPNVTYTFKRNKDIDGSSIPSEGSCGKNQKFNGTYNFREYDAITFSDMDKATCNASKVQAGNFYTFGRWNAGICYLGTSSYYLDCKTQSRKHHVDIETYKWQRSSACGCELAKACKEAGCAKWSTTWSALSPTKPNCSDNSCKYKEVPVYK